MSSQILKQSQKTKNQHESETGSVHVQLFATPWTIEPMEFSRPENWSGQPFPSSEDLPNQRIKPTSPTLQADYLPAEPQEKPKNTGVVSLALLQRIFPTQESNRGLLHCRWILNQLSYQGSLAWHLSNHSKCFSVPVTKHPQKYLTQYSTE